MLIIMSGDVMDHSMKKKFKNAGGGSGWFPNITSAIPYIAIVARGTFAVV
jgi:hypothetical protein